MKLTIRSIAARHLLAAGNLGLALLLSAHPTAAQAPAGPIPPKPGAQAQQPPQKPNIRVKVDIVNTPAVVTNAKGDMVLDLTQKDFRVYDNGVQQSVEDFDMGGAPISAAIVVETSSRIEGLLPSIRTTGILFTQTVLGPDGEATVIGYNDRTEPLLDFTNDRDAIEKTFSNLREGTSGARLYNALSQAVIALRNRPAGRRRILITVAEGVDTGSEEKLGQVLRDAQLANITVYSVGLSSTAAALRGPEKQTIPPSGTPPGTLGLPSIPGQPQGATLGPPNGGGNMDVLALAVWAVKHATVVVREHPLEIAAAGTGGLYQATFKDKSIETAIDHIGEELHAEYTLGYVPRGTGPEGYHEIKVTVTRPGLKVRSRPGYYPNA